MSHAGLTTLFWASEAVATAAYVRNHVLTTARSEDIMQYEKWYEKKPDLSSMEMFDRLCIERKILDKKTVKLRFIGFRLYVEHSRKVIGSRNSTFNEADFGARKDALEMESYVDPHYTVKKTLPTRYGATCEKHPRRSERLKMQSNHYMPNNGKFLQIKSLMENNTWNFVWKHMTRMAMWIVLRGAW